MRFSPGCECCNEVGGCCGCDLSPVEWDFTLPTISGTVNCALDPVACTDLAGTYTLNYNGGASCSWSDGLGSGPCGDVTATLSCNATDWVLTIVSGVKTLVQYTLARASWDCLGENVMNRFSIGGCSGWPATLTLTPA